MPTPPHLPRFLHARRCDSTHGTSSQVGECWLEPPSPDQRGKVLTAAAVRRIDLDGQASPPTIDRRNQAGDAAPFVGLSLTAHIVPSCDATHCAHRLQVQTPVLDSLVAEGIELTNFYAFKCARAPRRAVPRVVCCCARAFLTLLSRTLTDETCSQHIPS